jgi:hypothetical protein
LFAAEFHYFRIPREKWELLLARLCQMGVNTLTVALPWNFHQLAPDSVDLTGATHPRRDAAGLLELCRALNLYCLLQPGPYCHAGVLGEGIPLWYMKQADDPAVTFRSAVEGWFGAVGDALAGQQWPAGPVLALQLESRPDETDEPVYTKELTEVAWRIWLRKHYEGIEALNAAYGSAYHSVNEVAFPMTWFNESTPVEKDAREFLAQARSERRAAYTRFLEEAGWQIPIYSGREEQPHLPAIQPYSLLAGDLPQFTASPPVIVNLQYPIQVDPDPVDVGQGPVWAAGAPIRLDGSVRPGFWAVRRRLWPHRLPAATDQPAAAVPEDADGLNFFSAVLAGGGLVTASSRRQVKLPLARGSRPVAYQLRLAGEVAADDRLKPGRGSLNGYYPAEEDAGQTDLFFFLDDPASALPDFLAGYLKTLLVAQAQALHRAAVLADRLSQTLAPLEEPPPARPRPRPTSYTLAEARRGLAEADAALRKAMAAIGGLETGFDVILGQRGSGASLEPAAGPAVVRPEAFEGAAEEMLIDAGAACAGIAPRLKEVADTLQQVVTSPAPFVVADYQQSYAAAIAAARNAKEPLLPLIARLRLEIAAKELPLVLWRVHNQLQEIVETLRWGVLRG